MTAADRLERAALMLTCGYCSSSPGAPCVTASGRTSSRLHDARTTAVFAAWRVGYTEGLQDQHRTLRQELQHALTWATASVRDSVLSTVDQNTPDDYADDLED